MKIGAITIGQAPRTDVTADILHIFDDSLELVQAGGLDGLAVSDLGLLLVQILHLQAQQVAGGGEGEAGTGGVVAEDGDTQTGIEHAGALVALTQVAEGVGHGEDGVDLIVGLVPSPIEIGLVHIVDVQGGQMTCQLNSLAHFLYSPYKISGFAEMLT